MGTGATNSMDAIDNTQGVTGLVLAGGRGSRMGGVDKGLLEWHGAPVAQQVLERLRPQVSTLLISANRNLDRYRAMGVPVLTDDPAGITSANGGAASASTETAPRFDGPLAGVLAGLRACTTPWLACVPCDAPLFPHDLVARLMQSARAQQRPAAVVVRARHSAQHDTKSLPVEVLMEPAFCLLRRELAGRLAATLAAGERRWQAWLADCGAAEVVFDAHAATPGSDAADPFGNLNTPQDWARAAGNASR